MATTKHSTVVGVFDTRSQAELAVEELRFAGFRDSQLAMVMHHDSRETVEVTDLDAAKAAQVTGESKAGEGAAIGAASGAVVGGAIGVATALIPGVGPVISLGTLAATVFGVAAGAAGGGLVGTLIGLDFPEDEARFYEQELKAGRILVGVKAEDRESEAEAIMQRYGAYDATAQLATASHEADAYLDRPRL
jgi:hypothetical protein